MSLPLFYSILSLSQCPKVYPDIWNAPFGWANFVQETPTQWKMHTDQIFLSLLGRYQGSLTEQDPSSPAIPNIHRCSKAIRRIARGIIFEGIGYYEARRQEGPRRGVWFRQTIGRSLEKNAALILLWLSPLREKV